MSGTFTPREISFSGLMFGDRFRFAGDPEGTCYATVTRTQDYTDGYFSVNLLDGTEHHGSAFRKVVLLHRAPNCECGKHVDYCEANCEWPEELEALWAKLYSPAGG